MGVVDSATRSEIPRADHGHVRHPANILQCAELRARIYAAHYCDGLRAVTAHLMATVPFRSRARLAFRSRHVPPCSFRYRSQFRPRSCILLSVRSSTPIRLSCILLVSRRRGHSANQLVSSCFCSSLSRDSDSRPPTSCALSRVPTRGPSHIRGWEWLLKR